MPDSNLDIFRSRVDSRAAVVGVIGLGYVGLPLLGAFAEQGFACIGFDIDPAKIEALNAGRSYIQHIPAGAIAKMMAGGRVKVTSDYARIAGADAVLICVPTPLTAHREPDLRYVTGTAAAIQPYLRPGQLIVLESTTFPGTTTEILRPILERGGLESGADIWVAFSPEREDPANPKFQLASIPKVVGGDGEEALQAAVHLYRQVVQETVAVSSPETAEAVKLTENVYRAVNIAFVNELKVIYERMGIDVWEVIEAAATKPFGYTPFYPGPGLGGHCIPIDPFYLAWKAREFDLSTRFIELAGEINTAMPYYVMSRAREALERRAGRGFKGAKALLLGLAYKKNVDDLRESPALKLFEMLEEAGAEVAYHDPHIPEVPVLRHYPQLQGRKSLALTPESLRGSDVVLIVTDHDAVDYAQVVAEAPLIVDTRNATRGIAGAGDKVVKA